MNDLNDNMNFNQKISEHFSFEVFVNPFYSQENMTRLRNSVETTGGTVHEVDFDE